MGDRKVISSNSVDIVKQKKIMNRLLHENTEAHNKGIYKYFNITTFGCQQNNADSEKLKGMLIHMGYIEISERHKADIIIINTCCVRENAELKLYGNIGALKHIKLNNPKKIIAICGCMMEQEHAVNTIKKKYRHVDLVFGTHNLYKFPELLERSMSEKKTFIDILDTDGIIVEDIPIKREEKHRAWITIMYGCNNYCSYCIVPYVRGRERSRKSEDIIKEIKELAEDGCKEITLLGQNVNSYGLDFDESRLDFADLIKMVNDIDGIERIRFMTSHPKDISDKLIDTMKNCKKVCEHLHLPFQAGSNNILKAMNRKYTKEDYIEKINKVKKAIPNIALSTDVIVGFPGETEIDFEETLDVMRQVEFDQAFMFIYSIRKGTPAEKMEMQVDAEKKNKHFQKLIKLQNSISKKINDTYLEKVVEVLVDGLSKKDETKYSGRTRTGKVVNFSAREDVSGKLVNVKINEIHSWFLNGELVE